MKGRKQEIVLGAIVFIAICVLVFGTVWLSENYAGPAGGYKLKVRFDSVVGLNRGAHVTLRGVQVGKVLDIDIDEEGFPRAEIGFRHLRNLPVDTEVLIKSLGMLGEQMIEVHTGQSEQTFSDGAYVRGRASPGLEQLTEDAATMAQDIRSAVDTLLTQQNIDHLRRTISQMDSAVAIIHSTVDENRAVVDRTLQELADASAGAGDMVDENRKDVRASVERLAEATRSLELMSSRLAESGESLRAIMGHLEKVSASILRGEGTLGKLLVDESLYLDLRSTLTAVDSLMTDIKLNPGRYFTISVF
jgi:phospholipid/cholesterol/gamma-HCH transport system substrate-binding protein